MQEVIVQNFRAKPGTRMAEHPEPSLDELLWTAAAARIVLGPRWNIQAPPNLSYDEFPRLLDAGSTTGAGVAGDDRPREPGGALARDRAPPRATEARASSSRRALPIYPEYVADLDRGRSPSSP